MREAIRDLRRLLAGEEVASAQGPPASGTAASRRRPVYLLAAGPPMIELAGEVADGAFLMVGLPPAGVCAARHHLEEGANRVRPLAGRIPGGCTL